MNAVAFAGSASFENPPPGMFDALFRALEHHSLDVIGPARVQLLTISIHNDMGAVTGGFWGASLFQWLRVQMLFVPEILRGDGIGSALMRAAEGEARRRGCRGAFVDAFSFQAVGFYRKLGYSEFGVLADFPPGHHQVYLAKRF